MYVMYECVIIKSHITVQFGPVILVMNSMPLALILPRGDVWSHIYIYSKNMDQPGKVANPARGQLNREK